MATTDEQWMYVDAATGQQRGPLPETIVKRLIRRGLLAPAQFVWTQRLTEWQAVSTVAPFDAYCRVWFAMWYYIPDASTSAQQGPVSTKDLIALFLDGDIDGLTMVWSKEVDEWKPIGEVPSLKEFLYEANEDQDRETEALEAQDQVAQEDQVFEKDSADAFVAEDGKQYVFDTETKKWVTPQQKIEDDLEALREAAGELDTNGKNDTRPKTRVLPPSAPAVPTEATALAAAQDELNTVENAAATTTGANGEAAPTLKRKKKNKKKSDKWKKSKVNTWVYVNGLPLDVTVEEVRDHFARCGVIQTDLATGAPRIKLYKNKDYGGLNGDASVCYMKDASVELAVELLDKSHIRPEWPIDVSPAVFEQKGETFVKHKKARLDARAKVKRIEQEKALSWNEGEDGDRAGLRIVVIKHMFTPEEILDDTYEEELRQDIEEECTKIGEVTKVTLFAKHVDGVVVIKFASGGSAAKCVDVMNGRFFAGRKLECHFWDGADYTYRESKEEEQVRAEKFDEWLQGGSSSSEEDDEEDDTEEDGENGAEVHPGRHVPDEEEEEEEEEEEGAGNGEVHAGRVMPDLDDDDDDSD
ncbi:hypothetical protein Poli38472_002425 [Pythium oligandrum]|uniref:RRM domain-containing protein n=1 Tax=Pythium oligandrum TaxID=41045 RepID=A0A8K1CI44_PYTOL|nr:hypothetical protein Poli38472_002425 [Pythium oligandrum]|eukprot:TMW63484.1 hypothetical protein Poli38472_002425 [Pythium oligandrum]